MTATLCSLLRLSEHINHGRANIRRDILEHIKEFDVEFTYAPGHDMTTHKNPCRKNHELYLSEKGNYLVLGIILTDNETGEKAVKHELDLLADAVVKNETGNTIAREALRHTSCRIDKSRFTRDQKYRVTLTPITPTPERVREHLSFFPKLQLPDPSITRFFDRSITQDISLEEFLGKPFEEQVWLYDHNTHLSRAVRDSGDKKVAGFLHDITVDLSKIPPFSNYSPALLRKILAKTAVLQLENMCGVRCDFCGLDHNPAFDKKKYRQFSVAVLRKVFPQLPRTMLMLYYESDPFNYTADMLPDKSRLQYSYLDTHQMFFSLSSHENPQGPYVSTAVPRGHEFEVIRGIWQGIVDRMSISHMNLARLKAQGLILGQDELDTRTILRGCYNKTRLNATRALLEEKGVCTEEIRAYLRVQEVITSEPRMKDRLFGIGDYEKLRLDLKGVRYLGRARKKPKYFDKGLGEAPIACFSGSFISPSGVYNVAHIGHVSEKYPSGEVHQPISNIFAKTKFPQKERVEDVLKRGILTHEHVTCMSWLGEKPVFIITNPATNQTARYAVDKEGMAQLVNT